MNITEFFEKCKASTIEMIELDESLLKIPNKEEWTKTMIRRGQRQRELFAENNAQLAEYYALLQGDLSPKQMEEICDGVRELYFSDIDEYDLIISSVDRILPYFREKKDYESIIFLLYAKVYEVLEIERRLVPGRKNHDAVALLKEIASFSEHYSEIKDRTTRNRIWTNYYNLIDIVWDNRLVNGEESYQSLKEMLRLWNSDEVQKLDKGDEEMLARIDRIQYEWTAVAYMHTKELSEEALAYLHDSTDYYWNRELAEAGSEWLVSVDTYSAKLMQRVYDGEISKEDSITIFTDYLQKYMAANGEKYSMDNLGSFATIPDCVVDIFYLYISGVQRLHMMLVSLELDPANYADVIKENLLILYEKWGILYKNLVSTFLDEIVSDDAFTLLGYVDDREFQKNFFERVIVRRDVTTYLHTMMVSAIAKTIANSILQEKPSLFEGLFGYTGEEVKLHSGEILDFIENAAMCHDVGKFAISVIINTQTRKITDDEFATIKLHPMRGYAITQRLEFLKPYGDVIAGHHKFYNGKGGYPEEFDNTTSAVKIIIDLITICDCIDAATDFLGRNYRTGKQIDSLAKEFMEGAGTRYNPKLAEYLAKNKPLQKKLNELLTIGRVDACFRVYDEKIKE